MTVGPEGSSWRRLVAAPNVRRLGAWLAWWGLLMSLWIIVDDSVATDELLAGAGAAALAALLAELAGHYLAALRMRVGWLGPALRLPLDVARDTWIVFGALARTLIRREAPRSIFREVPVAFGAQTPAGNLRRALLIGARSLAPNTFALGIDAERNVMVVHQLDPEHAGRR